MLDRQVQTTSSTGGATISDLNFSPLSTLSLADTTGYKFSPGHLVMGAILKTLARNLEFLASYYKYST